MRASKKTTPLLTVMMNGIMENKNILQHIAGGIMATGNSCASDVQYVRGL